MQSSVCIQQSVAFGLFCDNIFVSVEYQLKIDQISKVEIKSLPTSHSVLSSCSHMLTWRVNVVS